MFTLIDLPCLMDPVKSGCWSRRHGVGWAVTTIVLANKSVYQFLSAFSELKTRKPLPPSTIPSAKISLGPHRHHTPCGIVPLPGSDMSAVLNNSDDVDWFQLHTRGLLPPTTTNEGFLTIYGILGGHESPWGAGWPVTWPQQSGVMSMSARHTWNRRWHSLVRTSRWLAALVNHQYMARLVSSLVHWFYHLSQVQIK